MIYQYYWLQELRHRRINLSQTVIDWGELVNYGGDEFIYIVIGQKHCVLF